MEPHTEVTDESDLFVRVSHDSVTAPLLACPAATDATIIAHHGGHSQQGNEGHEDELGKHSEGVQHDTKGKGSTGGASETQSRFLPRPHESTRANTAVNQLDSNEIIRSLRCALCVRCRMPTRAMTAGGFGWHSAPTLQFPSSP